MDFLAKLRELWNGIGLNQKINIILCFIVIAIVVSVALFYTSQPSYAVLFSSLEIGDAGKITAKLQDMNVPYKVTNSGKDILVPADKRYQIRLDIASEGLPSGGTVGFEIFDKQNLGMTEYVQKINFYRAVQGELARTISQMDEINSARVHIVFPEERFFSEQKSVPSASVTLSLKSPGALSNKQIYAIKHLISSSVENLSPSSITIVDTHGNLLSKDEGGSPDAVLSDRQMEMQKAVEDYLVSKSQAMLDKVLGRNMAVVRISASLNFERITQTQERYDPEAVVAAEVKSEETTTDTSGEAAPAGVEANINATSSTKAASASSGNKSVTKTQYEIGKVVEHVVKEVGNIKKLSVAIFVRQVTTASKDGKQTIVPADSDIEGYGSVVREAVGFDEKRGDKLQIKGVPYDTYKALSEIENVQINKELRSAKIEKLINVGVKYLFIASLAFSLLFMLKSTFSKLPSISGQRKEMAEKVQELEKAAQATMSMIEEEAAAAEEVETQKHQQKQKKIVNKQKKMEEIKRIYGENIEKLKIIVKESPEAVVALIDAWTMKNPDQVK